MNETTNDGNILIQPSYKYKVNSIVSAQQQHAAVHSYTSNKSTSTITTTDTTQQHEVYSPRTHHKPQPNNSYKIA